MLKFKHKPGVPPKRHEGEDDADYEDRCLAAREDEERAMLKACELVDIHFRSVTPNSAHSPTGRAYSDMIDFDHFKEHVLIRQSGGIDC